MSSTWIEKCAEQYVHFVETNRPSIEQRCAYSALVSALDGVMVDVRTLIEERTHARQEEHAPIGEI